MSNKKKEIRRSESLVLADLINADIAKIMTIDSRMLDSKMVAFIDKSLEPVYKDMVLKEHLYNAEDLMSEDSFVAVNPENKVVADQIWIIAHYARLNDCAYFRIVHEPAPYKR